MPRVVQRQKCAQNARWPATTNSTLHSRNVRTVLDEKMPHITDVDIKKCPRAKFILVSFDWHSQVAKKKYDDFDILLTCDYLEWSATTQATQKTGDAKRPCEILVGHAGFPWVIIISKLPMIPCNSIEFHIVPEPSNQATYQSVLFLFFYLSLLKAFHVPLHIQVFTMTWGPEIGSKIPYHG